MTRIGLGMALGGAALTATAFSVAGCSTITDGPAHGPAAVGPSRATVPVPAPNDCSSMKALLDSTGSVGVGNFPSGPIPADFKPTSLLRCVQDFTDVAGQGRWLVLNTIRSTGSVDAFTSALRAAYAKPLPTSPGGDYGCAAVGNVPQWIALVDAEGKAYVIAIPAGDVCGTPDQQATAALQAVSVSVVQSDRIRQISSVAEQASGCDPAWKNMPPIQAGQSAPKSTAPPGPIPGISASTRLKACFYKADYSDPQIPGGSFDVGVEVSGDQATAIATGLGASPYVVPGCTAKASEFVVLINDDGHGSAAVEVEIDGCKRLWTSDGPLRQPAQSVIDALLAARK